MNVVYFLRELFRVARGDGPEAKAAALAIGGGFSVTVIAFAALLWWMFFGPPVLYPIMGNVAFRGQPADGGIVIFEPRGGARIPTRTATIVNGAFQLRQSSGLQKNAEYRLRVEVLRRTGNVFDTADKGKTSVEYEQVHRSDAGGVEPALFVATRANTKNVLEVSVGD